MAGADPGVIYEERPGGPVLWIGPAVIAVGVIIFAVGILVDAGGLAAIGMVLAVIFGPIVWTTVWSISRYAAILLTDDVFEVGRATVAVIDIDRIVASQDLPDDVRAAMGLPVARLVGLPWLRRGTLGARMLGGSYGRFTGYDLIAIGVRGDADLQVINTRRPADLVAALHRATT